MIFSSSCKCGRMLSAYRLILSTTEPEQIQWPCLSVCLSEAAKGLDERGDELSVLNKLSICISKPWCLFKCHVFKRHKYSLARLKSMKQFGGLCSIE